MSEDRMQGIPRFDAHLVTDACGNKDVLMKEAHDGLFVRYADASRALQKLRSALEAQEKADEMWASDKTSHNSCHQQTEYARKLRRAALREAK